MAAAMAGYLRFQSSPVGVRSRTAPQIAKSNRLEKDDYYLQRTQFESIVERKLRLRQLTKDGNVEISGRDLR